MGFEVAIIGSGPSGFFAAEALLKADISASVHMFDRLPTPYGLVRSGVAPDHQIIKQVVKVFEAVARNPGFSFFGNVEIGKDISLETLRRRYDAVVLAYGASDGARLPIRGAQLAQSLTATEFVGWYNGHPDYSGLSVRFDHKTAVIVGHGNVAIDVARILLSSIDRLATTDIADHALDALRASCIRSVHLVGRRGPLQASFTTAELRELLLGMDGIGVHIDATQLDLSPDDNAWLDRPANAAAKRNFKVLQDAAAREPVPGATKELHLDFLTSPAAIDGDDRVSGIDMIANTLTGEAGARRAVATERRFRIPAGLVISSIGFRGKRLAGVPFDEVRGVVPNACGRVECEDSAQLAPLYVTGWIKRGPSGVIGTNRADSVETVQSVLEDFRAARFAARSKELWSHPITEHAPVTFSGWARIDEAERAAGSQLGRPRRKFVDIDIMLKVAAAF